MTNRVRRCEVIEPNVTILWIMNYNIVVLARSSVTMGMMQQNKVTGSKMCAGVAVFTPGGSPRVTEGCAIVEVVV
jgi:hypothetical protein